MKLLVTTAAVQSIVAVVAVYSIRGFIYPHLVVWVTALGLLPLFAIAAGTGDVVHARSGQRATYAAAGVSAIVLALAVTAPIERPPLVRAADVGAESLARSVATFLQSHKIERPVVRIVSSEQWPTAVAIVLFLDKQGVPVYVEDSWINVVGPLFTATAGAHPALLVGGPEFAGQARARNDLAFVGTAEGVSVFFQEM